MNSKNQITVVILALLTICGCDSSSQSSLELVKNQSPVVQYNEQDRDEWKKINTSGWSDSVFVSRDGQRLYFMYARYNYMPVFSGGQPELLGPMRPDHNVNDTNPFNDSDLYVSYRLPEGDGWSTPVNMVDVNNDEAQCCMIEVDTNPRKLYYQSNSYTTGNDLFYRVQQPDGTWGPEIKLGPEINSDFNEDNVHISANDDAMWFASNRPGGAGGLDIYFSAKVNGEWTPAVNVGPPINTAEDEDQFWASNVGTKIFFNRVNDIYETSWNGSSFTTPVRFDLGIPFAAEISMPDTEDVMYFGAGDVSKNRLILYKATKQADGRWLSSPID